jgi:hypothetical protein
MTPRKEIPSPYSQRQRHHSQIQFVVMLKLAFSISILMLKGIALSNIGSSFSSISKLRYKHTRMFYDLRLAGIF